MRLHELAKEIGAPSKELLALAKEIGLGVRSHSTALEPGQIALLRVAYQEKQGRASAAEEAAKKTPKKKRVRRKKVPAAEAKEEPVATADEEATPAAFRGEGAAVAEPAEVQAAAPPEAEAAEAPILTSEEDAEPSAPAQDAEVTEVVARAGDASAPTEEDRTEEEGEKEEEPEVTVRPRQKAKILGRIDLPREEIEKARDRTSGRSSDVGFEELPPLGAPTGGRGRHGSSAREIESRKRSAPRPKEDPLAWSPDDEDDPLLQGIRIRHVQTGPQHRRPPRRVGPRRAPRPRPIPAQSGPVDITVPISIRDLSQALGVPARDILRILARQGRRLTVNELVDEEMVLEVAAELDREVNIAAKQTREESFLAQVDRFEKELEESYGSEGGAEREPRPPVVAFLGHVDHGKTSLLDYIRKTKVAAGEAGGITQSMRAYSVETAGGHKITFLDTPGHKAFTEMRARGAHATDIVVLVVAADDGVMPQTEEAIQHAKAAGTPIVVALNKIDRPEANAQRVLQQLAGVGVVAESWGGDVQVAETSAVTGQGIDDLLEKILLQAELMELRADPKRSARGIVLEAKKDERLGPVATVLVQEGTLRLGDVVLAGTSYGRARLLVDDTGKKVREAPPSTPLNVVGLDECPVASERFYVVADLRQAREVAEERREEQRRRKTGGVAPPAGKVTLDNLLETLKDDAVKELRIVLRCDVQGSLEVLKSQLGTLKTSEVRVKLLREALGGITEDDVVLAAASKAVIIGFNVIADDKVRKRAEQLGVEIRTYQVIYELIDEVKAALEGLLAPEKREEVVGHVEVRETFKVSRLGTIAGCKVLDGVVRRNSVVRLTRGGRIVHTGGIESLKRFKEDVREVKEGFECGIKLQGYDDVKVGDVLEVVEVREERRQLDLDEAE